MKNVFIFFSFLSHYVSITSNINLFPQSFIIYYSTLCVELRRYRY